MMIPCYTCLKLCSFFKSKTPKELLLDQHVKLSDCTRSLSTTQASEQTCIAFKHNYIRIIHQLVKKNLKSNLRVATITQTRKAR